jgi:hypothetical protein
MSYVLGGVCDIVSESLTGEAIMTDNRLPAQEKPTANVDASPCGEGKAMSERLLALIEKARHIQMTPEEEREEEIGFAFGNAHDENDRITREMVANALSALDRSPPKQEGSGR